VTRRRDLRRIGRIFAAESAMRLSAVLFLLPLLACGSAAAAVYKCTNAQGAVEFKDKPCAPGTGGEIAVKGVVPATPADAARGGAGGGLSGSWCEWAVSLDRNGDKDDTAPVNWKFSADSVEYTAKGLGTIKARLVRKDGAFAVDHGMFGGLERDWDIVEASAGTAVLHGPIGGYYHLRKGSCP
jgi:Domain of unknown function (DUF4124)